MALALVVTPRLHPLRLYDVSSPIRYTMSPAQEVKLYIQPWRYTMSLAMELPPCLQPWSSQ